MKAIQVHHYGGPEVLEYVECPEPPIADDEILVKSEAIGVNFADILTRDGRYHTPSPLPMILGFEVAGTVVRRDRRVQGFREGDRVLTFARGGYAEYAIGPSGLVYPMPAGFSWEEGAAFLVAFQTAYHILKTAGRIAAGETVLIHAAAGGVGTAAVQLAKCWGARVVGTASSAAKLDLLRGLGVDAAINYAEQDFSLAVKDLTRGAGVQVVLDSIGGEVFAKSLEILSPLGRLVAFGMASGKSGVVEARQLQAANRAVIGISVGRLRSERPQMLQDSYRELIALLEAKKIHPVLGRTFPLAEAAAAHRFVSSRESIGKVLLKP